MPDTSWEESQKRNHHSRLWIWLIIALLGIFLAGTILHNNRDYIQGLKTPGNSHVSGAHVSRELFSADTGPRKNPGDSSRTKAGAGTARQKKPVSTAMAKQGSDDRAARRDSIEIKDIKCRVMDRNDIWVKLSVCLFYGGTIERRDLLVRREAMTVIVQKAIFALVLEEVKKDRIKPLLLSEINAVFKKNLFNDILIENIIVEKVNTE